MQLQYAVKSIWKLKLNLCLRKNPHQLHWALNQAVTADQSM